MNIQRIEPGEAKDLLDSGEGFIYVDVRTAGEYQAGHVPSAVNVPFAVRNPDGPGMKPNPDFVSEMTARFPKDARLILGCQRGGRSLKACRALIEEGFSSVLDMRGGYDGELDPGGNVTFPGWSRRGLPTSTD